MIDIDSQKPLPTQHILTILYWTHTLYQYYFHTINDKQKIVNVKSPPPPKENNSVYYFCERISLYSCGIVERRTNLMIFSSSPCLLNLQATISSAISRFVMLLLRQFPSLSVHDSAVRTKYLYLKFIWKREKRR